MSYLLKTTGSNGKQIPHKTVFKSRKQTTAMLRIYISFLVENKQ